MPIRYDVSPQEQLVRVEISGSLDAVEMMRSVRAIRAHEGLRAGFVILSDHRAISRPISPDELRSLVSILAEPDGRPMPKRMAALVASPASYGMMRMFDAFAGGVGLEVQPFHDEADALAWLNGREPAD